MRKRKLHKALAVVLASVVLVSNYSATYAKTNNEKSELALEMEADEISDMINESDMNGEPWIKELDKPFKVKCNGYLVSKSCDRTDFIIKSGNKKWNNKVLVVYKNNKSGHIGKRVGVYDIDYDKNLEKNEIVVYNPSKSVIGNFRNIFATKVFVQVIK